MFEAGNELRREHGADRVFDFSLGNPDVEPPAAFQVSLQQVVSASIQKKHGYMPNAGFPEVRERVAAQVGREQGVSLSAQSIIMSCGASGAMNCALKALLDPGDEVIVSTPCFMEYASYVDNHGGKLMFCPSRPDFDLDVAALERKIGPRTAAIIINSPNNPTGRIYSAPILSGLADILTDASRRHGHPIYLLSDEAYSHIVYDGRTFASPTSYYPDSFLLYTYGKTLLTPGQRLGYIALPPTMADREPMRTALFASQLCTGYAFPNALLQHALQDLEMLTIDVGRLEARRDRLVGELRSMGYSLRPPEGTFYLLPRSPLADDWAFVEALAQDGVFVLPGSLVEMPGTFRVSLTASDAMVDRALPIFAAALRRSSPVQVRTAAA